MNGMLRTRGAAVKGFAGRHSIGIMLFPYALLFSLFIIIPVAAAIGLSFTDFDTIRRPGFVGLKNYITLLTADEVFMKKVLPNTIIFSMVVGVGGYILSFLLAWSLAQLTKIPRTVMAIIIYLPSMTGGVLLSAVWGVIFSGEKNGYLNYALLKLGIIEQPVLWLQSESTLLTIMMIVTLWSSMGIGFLAILAGIMNVNQELYEAAYIDGVSNRFQEIIHITIPSTRPQMLFGAVMAIVNTFSQSRVGTVLSGDNPTPGYAGQLIVPHIEDYGFLRYEMGYAAAVSVALLLLIRLSSVGAFKLFGSKED
ncbi:MAG: sugar ABC transporter permease [Oscillospiraceae bacterium]|nr:sugar ABC transporter permease [Oscillospiraceae bacterium]